MCVNLRSVESRCVEIALAQFLLLHEPFAIFFTLFYEMDWETPEFLSLSAECLSADGVFLMDIGDSLLLWVGSSVPAEGMKKLFGKTFPNELKEYGQELRRSFQSLFEKRGFLWLQR